MLAGSGGPRSGGWIVLGILVGAIVGPGVALAAFSDIRIVGPGGAPPAADVTGANQLRAAEADPAHIRTWQVDVGGFSARCRSVDAPSGRSLMLKQVLINAGKVSGGSVAIYPNKSCKASTEIALVTPSSNAPTIVVPLEPGVPIASGGGFSLEPTDGALAASAYVRGYTMPSGAMPIKIAK